MAPFLAAVILDDGGTDVAVIDFRGDTPTRLTAGINFIKAPNQTFETVAWSQGEEYNYLAVSTYHEPESRINFYDFETGQSVRSEVLEIEGIRGRVRDTFWNPEYNDQFMITTTETPYFQAYRTGELHSGAWQLVHLDGPDFSASDFRDLSISRR